MASKTPKKRARIDAAAKDSTSASSGIDVAPSRCQPSPSSDVTACPKTGVSDSDAAGDGSAPTPTPTGQLRAELESARRCIEQLRREKTDEARRAREQSDAALRQLADRLRDERQRVIEQVRQRCAAESSRAAARHEREVHRLREELDRCRAELRDEQERRGGSLDAAERARLLQKVADAGAAKRRAEEAVRSAVDADRQKAAEIRRLHEDYRVEVARVSKEANVEIRRLLDELKMKDHQLALLNRNQYPDRGVGLSVKPMSGDCAATNDQDAEAAGQVRAKSVKAVKNGDLLQAETVAALKADVERLTSELKVSETDRVSLKDKLDGLSRELASINQPNTATFGLVKPSPTDSHVENVDGAGRRNCNVKSNNVPVKAQPKAVRFLLPGETLPVPARETPTMLDDDSAASVNSDVSDTASLSSVSSSSSPLRLSPDSTSLYDENILKNYHHLLSEHLSLQRNVANLLSSWSQMLPVVPSKDEKTTCGQECTDEKESMKVTIEMLKDKLGKCEETEYRLHQQLKDHKEINEELEFRLFELQECSEKNKYAESDFSVVDLLEKNQSLEIEVSMLRQKVAETMDPRTQPSDALLRVLGSSKTGLQMDAINREIVPAAEQKNGLVEHEDGRLLVVNATGEKTKVEEETLECCLVVETAVDGGSDGTVDLEDDQLGLMTCSLSSTTSGFDDNSCASSLVDGDDMPSEETWNFDVHEEVCQEPTKPSGSDGENSQQSGIHSRQTTITEELVKQMEKIWLSRMEKLERRLMQAVEGEQRARDQMALLSEEKDRRIAALEHQVDTLEANDFHLTKTIHTLEQLERVFSSHLLSVKPHHLHSDKATGTSTSVVEQEDENCYNDQMDQVKPKSEETGIDSVVGHPCRDKTCLQCHVCQTLRDTVEQLHLALAEQSEVDKRVRALEEGIKDTRTSTSDDRAAFDVVDFEAEYRELEALVKELKQVLVVDRSTDGCPVIKDLSPTLSENKEDEQEVGIISSLPVHWNLDDDADDDDDDETVSMVADRDSEVDSPALTALNERNRSLEITEQYLRQQVSDLETERDQLQEIVRNGESTITDLGMSLVQLQTSEKSMTDEASRLRAKNEWMTGRIDGLLELVGRLEEADRAHRTTAGELRLRAERHSAGEADLRRELDNAVDEQRRAETRCRRWVGQLEDERDALATRVDELAERNAELEGREAALECRVRKMETVEQGLRCELADLERALADKVGEIFEERLLTESLSNIHDDLQYSERAQNNCQATGLIVFLKQKLERMDRSNLVLDERLREKTACEQRLRETVEECQKSDSLWQEKVMSLELQKKTLMQHIDELQAELTDIKGMMMCGLNDTPAAAMKGVVTPETVDEDAYDVELATGTAVDGATNVDDDDPALTSPHWSRIAEIMDLNAEAVEEKETYVQESKTNIVEKTKVETQKVVDCLEDTKPPLPLFVSPPSELEITYVCQQMTGSSITVVADEPYESVSTVSLKCTDQKPEVESVFAYRKLIVIRAADIPRSRSADIFRPDNVFTTSGPATARAQSETRDVEGSWNALSKTKCAFALKNLTSPQENRTADDYEARQTLESEDNESDSTSEMKQQTDNEEIQTGNGNVTIRPSLIPRLSSTQTADGGRKTPRSICSTVLSSSRSLIPRPVIDNRNNSSGGESEASSTSSTTVSDTSDKSAEQNKSESAESSVLHGSLSSTGARSGDTRQEPAESRDVCPSSFSSASSCPGTSSVAPDSRE